MNIVSDFLSRLREGQNRGEGDWPAIILLARDNQTIAETYTWSEYFQQAQYFALALQNLGIVKINIQNKDPQFVPLLAQNLPVSFFAFLGTILAGGVPAPLNILSLKDRWGRTDIKHILNECQQSRLFTNDSPKVKRILNAEKINFLTFEQLLAMGQTIATTQKTKKVFFRQRTGTELLIMPYTSGTDGQPKGVMLSYLNIADRVWAICETLSVSHKDRLLSYLPLGHISGLIADLFSPLLIGYTIYCTQHSSDLPDSQAIRENLIPILKKIKPTVFLAVPKVWNNLRLGIEQQLSTGVAQIIPRILLANRIKKALGLDCARHLISAADWLKPQTKHFFGRLCLKIKDIYGQTETGGPLTIDGQVVGSQTCLTLSEVDEEMLVSGPNVMLGYYKKQPASENPTNVWYHTGDIGRQDPNSQRIFYVMRKRENFKNQQGEFVSGLVLQEQKEKIQIWLAKMFPELKDVSQVYIYGASRPFNILLVFIPRNMEKLKPILQDSLEATMPQIGEGKYQIRKIAIFELEEIITTATAKERWRMILTNLKNELEALYQ